MLTREVNDLRARKTSF